MKKLFLIVLMIASINAIYGQQIITQWAFNGTTEPSIGEGTAALIGGTVEVDLDDRWRMVGFPDQFEASGTAGAEFLVSTEGFENILLSYGHRSSGTQSRWAEVQYTLDGGDSWEVLANNDGGLSPHDVIYNFSFDFTDIAGANDNPGFGVRVVSVFSPVPFNPEEPDEEFEANTAYHRARTEGTGGNPYAGGLDGGNWRLHNVTLLGDPMNGDPDPDPDPDPDLDLLHFMVFDGSLPNNTPLEMLAFTYSDTQQAFIYYYSSLEGYPYHEDHPLWRKASMERRNAPTPINYYPEGNYGIVYEDADMRGLQVKQPFKIDDRENTIVFHLPTIMHKDILFAFAAKDEGAADRLIIDYSIVEDETAWLVEGLEDTEVSLSENYQLFSFDFNGVPGVENNPYFRIRIRFDGDDMGADEGNRVTFNNFSLHAKPIDDVSINEAVQEPGIRVSPNPASEQVNIEVLEPGTMIRIYDLNGIQVFQKVAETGSVTFNVSQLPAGYYIIRGLSPSGKKPVTGRFLVK